MKRLCINCAWYRPSELPAGGRCKFNGKIAEFPDLICHTGKFKAKAKPEEAKQDPAIGPDPDKMWP